MKKSICLLCIALVLVLSFTAYADNVDDMLGGKQDYVILGSVKDIKDEVITVTVDHVLGGAAPNMTGTDVSIAQFAYSYCEEHSTEEFRSPIVSDNIVISINKSAEGFEMANCAYKVDSNEYASCKIIVHEDLKDEDCLKSLLEATCFIRSNAKVKEFEFDEEGRIYAVYPQTAEQCVHIVGDDGAAVVNEDIPDTLPTVPPAAPSDGSQPLTDNRWIPAICILASGALGGAAGAYIITVKRNR